MSRAEILSSASSASEIASNAATQQGIASEFVKKVASDGLSVLADKQLSDDQKRLSLKVLLETDFDLAGIAKFVLGPGQKLTEDQQARYQKLFEEMILRIYYDQLKLMVIRDFTIVSSSLPDDDQKIMVRSTIKRAEQSDTVAVQWILNCAGRNAFKVFDVIVNDISLSVLQAREIRALLLREGSVDAFLDRMQEKFGTP